jgi:hypothetical protein
MPPASIPRPIFKSDVKEHYPHLMVYHINMVMASDFLVLNEHLYLLVPKKPIEANMAVELV